jgi:hypothetical protein
MIMLVSWGHRPDFDPTKETPLEYNRRWFPHTLARLERLRALSHKESR